MTQPSVEADQPTAPRLVTEAGHPSKPEPALLARVAEHLRRADASAFVGDLTSSVGSLSGRAQNVGPSLGGALHPFRWPHLLVLVVVAPLAFLAYQWAAGPSATGAAWTWLLALDALVAAAVLATYVPGTAKAASPCAASAGLQVIFALFLLGLGPTVPMRGVFAFGALTFALVQRTTGNGACSIR